MGLVVGERALLYQRFDGFDEARHGLVELIAFDAVTELEKHILDIHFDGVLAHIPIELFL